MRVVGKAGLLKSFIHIHSLFVIPVVQNTILSILYFFSRFPIAQLYACISGVVLI